MQIRKLKRILEDTEASIVSVSTPVFMYLANEFTLVESVTPGFAVGSLRVFRFDSEDEVKKRFARSKLFVKSCKDEEGKLVVRAFEWREKPWLK